MKLPSPNEDLIGTEGDGGGSWLLILGTVVAPVAVIVLLWIVLR